MITSFSVYALAGDIDGGCGFYRIREPARVAADLGLDITVDTTFPMDALMYPNGKIQINSIDVNPDVVIFQRPLLNSFYDTILYLQKRGIACVVEIDDDLVATSPRNIAYEHLNPKTSKISNWDQLVKCCEIADLVTTSTPHLARRYAKHGRFKVLRNMIPEAELKREKLPRRLLRVGWTGTLQTHPEDLDVAGSQISAALNQFAKDKNFYVVGDGEMVKEKLFLKGDVIPTGWVPRPEYIETLSQHIDIGVVPLKIDDFNKSKSSLKMLEMSSQGIPTVVSPTPENVYLAQFTGSKVVNKPRDWQKGLKQLLTNHDYYLERSEAAREGVRDWTYENHGHEWIEAWAEAIKNRQKA